MARWDKTEPRNRDKHGLLLHINKALYASIKQCAQAQNLKPTTFATRLFEQAAVEAKKAPRLQLDTEPVNP